MFISVETIGGGTATINVSQVTHLTVTGHGTQIYFSSGEQLICTKTIGELTLELGRASA